MPFNPPKKLELARIPTPIQPLRSIGKEHGIKNLHVKRDDLTGVGMSGNKVRKLEYLLADALRKKATTIMTCGAAQSNHARATAVAASRLGLRSVLFLKGKKFEVSEGNLFIDKLLGSDIRFLSSKEYRRVDALMSREAKKLERNGCKSYIIPEGGSNELGILGYVEAAKEIKAQERSLKIRFDYIITPVGSGGTMSGLLLGKNVAKLSAAVVGFNVSGSADSYVQRALEQVRGTAKRWKISGLRLTAKDVQIVEGYEGPGYGIPTSCNLSMIKHVAQQEGIFLDPVYGAKAFCGMLQEIEEGRLDPEANFLFICTGGIYGLLAQREHFDFL